MILLRSALRGNEFGGVGRAAAEIVFAVGTDAEVRRVPIDANFAPASMRGARGKADVLAALEEVAVSLHHRAGIGIESFKQTIVEFDCWIRVVLRWKTRRGTVDADG